MKVVIIGGVAAGPKVASKIMRNEPNAEVTIIEKGEFLSYAGCGLPYYISGEVENQAELMATPVGTIRDTAFFRNVKNVNVLNHTEAIAVDRTRKSVKIKNEDGSTDDIAYDKLVFATGAVPSCPPIPGIAMKNIFTLHGVEDAEGIKAMLGERKALDCVIVGGGLIGVEVAEALIECGCRVTMVEMQSHILGMLDPEMAGIVERYFESKGIQILTSTTVQKFEGDAKVQRVVTDKKTLNADMVVLAIGVRPNSKLAADAGVELGSTGAIRVEPSMRTSDENIYAAGDCCECSNIVTGKPCFVPLGSTANKQGRVAANNICGIKDQFPGVAGSSVCKVFDFSVARTGLSENVAIENGFEPVCCYAPAPDKAHFIKSARPLFIKLIADKKTRKLLGAQAVGLGIADKRMDVVATALSAGMTIDQLANLDLCYAPPFSPAVDNILTAANILRNKLDGRMIGIKSEDVKTKIDNGDKMILLDVRSPGELETLPSINGAVNIPLGKLRKQLEDLGDDKNMEIIAFCKISLRGYEASIILKNAGFENVKVMEGGMLMWPYKK